MFEIVHCNYPESIRCHYFNRKRVDCEIIFGAFNNQQINNIDDE